MGHEAPSGIPARIVARLRPATLAAALLGCLAAASAQTGAYRTRYETWSAHYWDAQGQQVTTLAGKAWLSLAPDWRLGVKGLGEWIRIPGAPDTGGHAHSHHAHGDDHAGEDPGGASTDIDAVSGASIRAHGHHGSGEGRGEATLSLRRDLPGANPAFVGAGARYSGESDFHSAMATLNGGIELFKRNTAVTGYLGAGLDYSVPDAAPPGEASLWPSASTRLAAGVQVGQLLSPRLQAGLSYAITSLAGTLENPYRRARILTTLFPERLPDLRHRHVAGAEIGAYLGFGAAVFHRQGAYADSWGVRAWIPETALPVELGERWLVTPRHKYYYQLPADFYRTSYSAREGHYTGDIRLGHLEGHELGVEAEYALGPGTRAPALTANFSWSDLRYLSGGSRDRSFVVGLAFRMPE